MEQFPIVNSRISDQDGDRVRKAFPTKRRAENQIDKIARPGRRSSDAMLTETEDIGIDTVFVKDSPAMKADEPKPVLVAGRVPDMHHRSVDQLALLSL